MTQSEQKEFDQLREQLACAEASAEQVRSYFLNTLVKMTDELRLYRGLFWCLLAFTTVATILNLLQR
jgi:hypothetical protein